MAKKTIKINSFTNIHDEKVAESTISHVVWVEITSADKVQAHSTAGGKAEKLFALEDYPQGNGLSDDYSALDTVLLLEASPGDKVYATLDDASNVTAVVIGDFVESAGDGRLRKNEDTTDTADEYPGSIVGVALEAQSTAGGRFIIKVVG